MKQLPTVYCLTPTAGRFKMLRRVLKCFLEQDYEGESVLLIFNNSRVPFQLGEFEKKPNQHVVVLHRPFDVDGLPYKNLGRVFAHMYRSIRPDKADVVTFMDDDDFYLPNHISEGVKGYLKAEAQGKLAYKPYYSWFKSSEGQKLAHNTHEPSFFTNAEFIRQVGFHPENVTYHLKWVDALTKDDKLFVDPDGVPTFVYDWSGETPVYKISGNDDEHNWSRCKQFSQDFGTGLLTPLN